MDSNRTGEWLMKVRELTANEIADAVDAALFEQTDTYEYECIVHRDPHLSMKESLIETLATTNYNCPCSHSVVGEIKRLTNNLVGREQLSERINREIDLYDGFSKIRNQAWGTQDELKCVERALFDDNGDHFRKIFRRIAGGEA